MFYVSKTVDEGKKGHERTVTLGLDHDQIKAIQTDDDGNEVIDIYDLRMYCHFQIQGVTDFYYLRLATTVGHPIMLPVPLTAGEAHELSAALSARILGEEATQ